MRLSRAVPKCCRPRIGRSLYAKERIQNDVRNAVQSHWDGGMDELYGHYRFEQEKRDALDRWARHLASLLSGQAAARVTPCDPPGRSVIVRCEP
jgi:hypothetical protein